MRRPKTALVSLAALAFLGAACEDTTTTSLDTSSTFPTSLLVEPAVFLGDVPCTNAPGGMQSYVATVRDVTDSSATPFDLPSSPAVSCTGTATFRQVLDKHVYRLEIDGYDVPATELLPLGGISSGSRIMVRKGDPSAQPVMARWTTWCTNVTAAVDARVVPTKCEPLVASSTTTGVLVDPRGTLLGTASGSNPGLVCREVDANGDPTGPGDVASFDVIPADPALPPLVNVPCSAASAAAPYTQGIEPGRTYEFRVEARADAGGPMVWGASCTALAVSGLVTAAVCDPLSPDGAVDVSLAGLLDAAGASCSAASVSTYDVALVGPTTLSAVAVPCDKPVRFSPVEPGAYVATIVGRSESGSQTLSASCMATAVPGGVSTAVCKPL